MKLSDARMRCRQTKLLYLKHRSPPWFTEDAPRDRSNRLLESQVRKAHTATGNATSSTAAPNSQMLCNSGPAVPKSRDIVGISIKPQIMAVMVSASGTPRRPYTRPIIQAKGREIDAIATT
jgi:hypothetical protein